MSIGSYSLSLFSKLKGEGRAYGFCLSASPVFVFNIFLGGYTVSLQKRGVFQGFPLG